MSTDLSRIQAAEGIFVTDANTQFSPLLTTTPAGTEAGLAVRDCTIGQNTMANSRPVVIASNQSSLTIQGALTNNNAAPSTNNIGALVALCNTAAPTFTNGDQTLLSVDTAGSLRVNVQSSITQANNLTQVGGSAIALGQTTMSASLPVAIASNQSNLVVVGNLTHNNAAPTTTNIGALVAVASTAAPTYTNTDQVLLSTDLSGNLRVAVTSTGGNSTIISSQPAATTGTITTSASTVVATVTGYNSITISVNGTYAGVNFTFEMSDDGGTTYYPASATRTDNGSVQTSTGVLTANSTLMWIADIGGVTNFRVRATAYTSGTANIHLTPIAVGSDSTSSVNMYAVGGSAIALGQTTMSASLPVAIASNQSTLNVQGALTHNNAAPTATNIGALVAVASTAAPTYTTGDQVLLSTDLSGNLRTSTTLSGTTAVNLTQVAGSAIALGQTTMSASLPVAIASNQSNLVVVGNLTNNNAAPTTTNLGALVALCNTSAPTFTNGDQTLLSVDTAGNLRVAGSGTAGTPAGGVLSVQGVAGGTAQPISGTVTANAGTGNFTVVGTLTNNNAAPTTTNVGALVALCNTAAPTFTNGDQTLLSVDTAGNLRVNIIASATQSNNLTQVGGSAIALGQTTMSASLPVVIASNQSALNVLGNQVTATSGTITTSSSTVSVSVSGYNAVTVSVNGTYAGVNFTFEASDDGGTTYYAVAASRADNTASQTTTGVITANSSIMWTVYINAVTNFRVRATAYTSGTANIHLTPAVMGVDSSVIANITEVGGSAFALGQNTMANSLPVTIASNQTNTVSTGSNYSLSVGTSAVQLTAAAANQGVQIVADPAGGSNYIYIGLTSGVTAGTNAATDGIKLAAGAGIVWPLSNANLAWAIASAVSQKIFVAAF